jgi:hypothetical protein
MASGPTASPASWWDSRSAARQLEGARKTRVPPRWPRPLLRRRRRRRCRRLCLGAVPALVLVLPVLLMLVPLLVLLLVLLLVPLLVLGAVSALILTAPKTTRHRTCHRHHRQIGRLWRGSRALCGLDFTGSLCYRCALGCSRGLAWRFRVWGPLTHLPPSPPAPIRPPNHAHAHAPMVQLHALAKGFGALNDALEPDPANEVGAQLRAGRRSTRACVRACVHTPVVSLSMPQMPQDPAVA